MSFLILITLAAKKADRYALPALVVWPVLAGWLFSVAWPMIQRRLPSVASRVFGVVLALAVLSVPLTWAPYAIAYNNPLFPTIRPLSQQGWGEGLEQVGQWLAQQPLGQHLMVASWYPSVLQTFHPARVLDLNGRENYRVAYVVTYRNMQGRAADTQASEVLHAFAGRTPIHTVMVAGLPYAWVYAVDGVGYETTPVEELVPGIEIGQRVTPTHDTWQGVRLILATFSGRVTSPEVVLHIRDSAEAAADIRTVRVSAQQVQDNRWHTFDFAPIEHAANRSFYISVSSPNGELGNAVTVRAATQDLLPGELVVLRHGKSRVIPERDLAYELLP